VRISLCIIGRAGAKVRRMGDVTLSLFESAKPFAFLQHMSYLICYTVPRVIKLLGACIDGADEARH